MSAEVKPGYKQTELGVIPEDWDVRPLGQLVHAVEYGSSAKSSSSGKIPVLRMGNLQEGKIDWSDLVFTDNESEIAKYLLNPGDVLFNRTNTIELVGKTAIYKGIRPSIFAGYLIRIKEKKDQIDSRYLNYFLNSKSAKNYGLKVLSVAVGQANINGQKLKTYPVVLPPTVDEQSSIATAVSEMEEFISSLEQLIAKKRDIQQATMQQLLTCQRRLPEFSAEWEVRRLGDLADMSSGGTPSTSVADYYGGSIPWVSISDMTDAGKIIYSTAKSLTELGLKNCAAQIFPAKTIFYAMYASIGECSIAGRPMSTSQAILGIRTKPALSSDFLYYYLSSIKCQVKNMGQQGTQANLNAGMVRAFKINLPSLEEQTAIATVLSDMDAELAVLEARRNQAWNIKLGMMQELLTGRVRLR